MKPQRQEFSLNRSSGTSREYESASDWGWWEQMITQASKPNKQHQDRYITTEERTLLDRQSSVTRAQYDMAKHELLSNSSISVVQRIDIKLWNKGKHYSDKTKRKQGNLKLDAPDQSSKAGPMTLNECCSYCNLTTKAHVNELDKRQRHRLGVAHNVLGRTACDELSSRSSAIPRYKVDKRKHERAERLQAKPVHSDTMTNNLTSELQTVMIKIRPERARLLTDSSMYDKTKFKSKKPVKKYRQNTEHTKMPVRPNYLEHKPKCLILHPDSLASSDRERNNSKYDSFCILRQSHHDRNKLIQQQCKLTIDNSREQSNSFNQSQIISIPPEITRKYRETVQTPCRRQRKPRYSERKERTEIRRSLVLSHTKSVDSAENSTLRKEYTDYNNKCFLRQAEVKSSLALNIECNKADNIKSRKDSQPRTRLREISKANREHLAREILQEGHALKRCSCEVKLHSDQSILNVFTSKDNADSKLLSSLSQSNDYFVKRDQRKTTLTDTSLNNFTSISIFRATSKEAQTSLNIKEENNISATSSLLVKPAVVNLHDFCGKSMISMKLDVPSGMSYQSKRAAYRSMEANDRILQNRFYLTDSQSTITNFREEQRDDKSTNCALPSVVNISSLSLFHAQQLRKLPNMEASYNTDIKTSSNLFNHKTMSAVSFMLSSVTIQKNIRPKVCRRNRISNSTSTDSSEYFEIPKIQPMTKSVLDSPSKISLFNSDSITNFLMIQQPKNLLISDHLTNVSKTSIFRLARTNKALVCLETQDIFSISRSQLMKKVKIIENNVEQEKVRKIQTVKKSPSKNAWDKLVRHSQFSRSFCTMNLQLPVKDLISAKPTRHKSKDSKEEPRLFVLYHKDLSMGPTHRKKTDLRTKHISRNIRRPVPKELSRIIKPSKSQKHMGSNLKRVKFEKNDQARISKYTTKENTLVSNGRITPLHKQESQPKAVRRQLCTNCITTALQEPVQIRTYLSFKDVNHLPSTYPITSGSKNSNHGQRKNSIINNENEINVLKTSEKSHQNDGKISNKIRLPVKSNKVKIQTKLQLYKNILSKHNQTPKFHSETRTNKGWKSVINKCVKTIKSMTTKKASIAVNTNMSAAHCYSNCKEWEHSCYFCTTSRETPKRNKLSTQSKIISNVDYMDCKDNNNFLKRCCGTLNFDKNRNVQDPLKSKKNYTQILNNKINSDFAETARIIYQNPATYVYRICDNYKDSKQSRTFGTKTDDRNMSISMITSHGHPLHKSKSAQSKNIPKHQSNKLSRNLKSYEIETIFPLACNKFHRSKSETVLSQCQNIDESNVPNSVQETEYFSISNKSRVLKKRKKPTVNKMEPTESTGSEYIVNYSSSVSRPSSFKKFLIRCMTLFRCNIKTQENSKAMEVKSKVNKFNSKHKEEKPSSGSLKPNRKHTKEQGTDLKKCKSYRQHKESVSLLLSEKCKSLKMSKEFEKAKGDKRHLQESADSIGNKSKNQSGDADLRDSKITNNKPTEGSSHPSNYYRQDKLYCGYAQIQSNTVANNNTARLLIESPHRNVELPRFRYLSDKIKSQKSVNFKKTGCQIMRKDVGTDCNCKRRLNKRRLKNKTKCVQAETWDEKAVLMMSGDRKSDYSPQYKCEPKEARQKRTRTNDPVLKKMNEDDVTTKYVTMENDKIETKIKHTIATKCKNFLKINKPQVKETFGKMDPRPVHVDYETKNKVQTKKIKPMYMDNATKLKCTQTTPKAKKAKSTKPVNLAKTTVKALQVDGVKLAVIPRELVTLPFNNTGKKNEATICDRVKKKNKSVKTKHADRFLCCKSTSTYKIIRDKTRIKQKPIKNTAIAYKTLSSVNRNNDIFASTAVKQRIEETAAKAKKALASQKPVKTGDNDVLSVTTAHTPNKCRVKAFHKPKQEKNTAKTTKVSLSNKAVMTRDAFVSSCCTNTTPSVDKKIGAKIFAKYKQQRNTAKAKKALPSNKTVETKDVDASSRGTNTTSSYDKKTGAKICVRKKQDINASCTKKPLRCPPTTTTKLNRTGISVIVRKENTAGDRKQPDSCNAKPFVKGTQTKIKRKAKLLNTTEGVRITNKTKIFTTVDKQTSASTKCMAMPIEAPAKYSTMMSANRTKQICCALYTAGAWHSKATVPQSNQASAASSDKHLRKTMPVVANCSVTCSMNKQINSKKSKRINAVAKENIDRKLLSSKSKPCCICGTEICKKCKAKYIKNSTEKRKKGHKKSKKLNNKGEIDDLKNTVSIKMAGKGTRKKIKQNNKSIAKEEKKREKINKLNNKSLPKEAKKREKINKRDYKRMPKENNTLRQPSKKKKEKVTKIKYQSVKKGPKKILIIKDGRKSKRMTNTVKKQKRPNNKTVKETKVKVIRRRFHYLTCSARPKKRNRMDPECQRLYKTTFKRKIIIFMYVRSFCNFIRCAFRRILGCLFFACGVIVWTPCICCFECCRECMFCCCSSYK